MSKEKRITKGFDLLSPVYDRLTGFFFGKKFRLSQTYFLPQVADRKCTLIIGGGTGWILEECIRNNVSESYFYVDISQKMIAKAKALILKKHVEKAGSVIFIEGTYNDLPADVSFDLIISPYFLDLFSEQRLLTIIRDLKEKLTNSGTWYVSDFNISNESKAQNYFTGAVIKLLYLGFHIICGIEAKSLPRFNHCFFECGFKPVREKYFLKKLVAAKLFKKKS